MKVCNLIINVSSIRIFQFYVSVTFLACLCNAEGSEDDWCNVGNGQCFCRDNIIGRQCDHCVEGFYGFPTCVGMYVGDSYTLG